MRIPLSADSPSHERHAMSLAQTEEQHSATSVRSISPVRVLSWLTSNSRSLITAVHAPLSADDQTPWVVFQGKTYKGRYGSDKIPASAKVIWDGSEAMSDVEDMVWYEVVVDGMDGIGIRNSPLTNATPTLPWAVSLFQRHRNAQQLDALPDDSVRIVRRADHAH